MPLSSRAAALLALLPLPVQQPLFEQRGLGSGVADLGDVDGDGVSDFLAGGVLHAVSGRTLRRLFRREITIGGPAVPYETVEGAGDLNGDGRGDVLVGSSVWSGASLLAPRHRIDRGGGANSFEPLLQLAPPAVDLQIEEASPSWATSTATGSPSSPRAGRMPTSSAARATIRAS
jgi:hypothetical protein